MSAVEWTECSVAGEVFLSLMEQYSPGKSVLREVTGVHPELPDMSVLLCKTGSAVADYTVCNRCVVSASKLVRKAFTKLYFEDCVFP